MSIRVRDLGVAMLIAYVAMTSPGRAETISYADAVTKFAADCGKDVKKLCAGLNLGSGRIMDCLQQNAAKVSPTCKSTTADVVTSIKEREAAQSAYFKVCRHDIAQRCRGIKGDGYQLSCLLKTTRMVGDKCNQAITDAGWR